MNLFLLALAMLIGGLLVCFLSGSAKYPVLVTVVWWIGIVIVLCGALLLLCPILIYVSTQLRQALGT